MDILIFYNGAQAQSIAATAVIKTKYQAHTVTITDLQGKNEGQMTTAIDTGANMDRVFCTCITTGSYSTAGSPSEDVNVPLMTARIKAGAVAPWNATILLGTATATKNPIRQAWDNAYASVAYPPIVKYLGGTASFPLLTATADSVAAGSVTDAGAFTASAHIGQFVYVSSATTGAGQVVKIASNTTGALTLVHNWTLTPTGTVVYGITEYQDDALRAEYLALAVKSKLWNIGSANIMNEWYKLLDMGSYDSSYNSINDGNLAGPITDSEYLEGLVEVGRSAYEYNAFPCYGVKTVKKLK